jgi:hypothetical protein
VPRFCLILLNLVTARKIVFAIPLTLLARAPTK